MSQQKPIARPVTEEAAVPLYVTTEDDFSGPHGSSPDPRFQLRLDFVEAVRGIPAVRGHWECPHCRMSFDRRKPCCMHMGLMPDKPASCPVLRAQDQERRGT